MYGGHSTGERVTEWKTLSTYRGRNRFGFHLWMWICGSCGSEYGPSTVSHLRRGGMCQDCALRRGNNARWLGHEEISGSFLYQYRSDAAKKGRVWDVTPAQLWAKWQEQGGRCAYTGWPLKHGIDASIDRIDNAIGYTVGNVQWVHRDINRMKTDFSEAYFVTMCAAVAGREVQK